MSCALAVLMCRSLFSAVLSASVDAFRSVSRLSSPIDKLSCVVSVAKAICACVDQAKVQAQARAQAAEAAAAAASDSPSPAASAASSLPSPVVIGADDLLLLFAYLLIHSRVENLVAELAFLADFIPEHQRCTMQGYYLATTQAAAELLASDELQQTIAQREAAAANGGGAGGAADDDDAANATAGASATAASAAPVTTPLVPLDPPAPSSQPALANDVGALGALEEKGDSEARR